MESLNLIKLKQKVIVELENNGTEEQSQKKKKKLWMGAQ